MLATITIAQIQPIEPDKLTEEISAFSFIIKGGFVLIPITLLLFYAILVIVEKILYIRRIGKYNSFLLSEMRFDITTGNILRVLDTLSRDQTAFGSVIKEGVLTIGRPIFEVEYNMDKRENIEISKMEKNLFRLGLIAGIAPALGFISSISGVVKIFYGISSSKNESIVNITSELYEELISSGVGLIVGIIAFSAYLLLNAMIDNYVLTLQKVKLEFLNLIKIINIGSHEEK
jgi:biopolymer transport protein ExbB